MFYKLVNWLIARAQRTPYSHLYHTDGSLYMGRWWLFQTRWLSARVHLIATHDFDHAMHDHPWSFLSILLRGWYLEARPSSIEPCFLWPEQSHEELSYLQRRNAGSIAYRRATDRHRIACVSANCYTLVFVGPRVHWWGFFTPAGKIFWKHYDSAKTEGREA